jgi:uracil phosphoribosyltransferase
MGLVRNKETKQKEFEELISEIAGLLTYEITRDLAVVDSTVVTPISKANVKVLAKEIVIVPILRAGLGMMTGIKNLIPSAKIGFIGLYRDEKAHQTVNYYCKLPEGLDNPTVLICDPMLATGDSLIKAIEEVHRYGYKDITYVGIIGCEDGIKNVSKKFPDISIYLAEKDNILTKENYISPGLGDCGDRLFGTK